MGPRHESGAIKDPLRGLRQQLVAEYGMVVRPETIDQVIEQAFAGFEDARIREFVPILAWRRARELLLGLPESAGPIAFPVEARADISRELAPMPR